MALFCEECFNILPYPSSSGPLACESCGSKTHSSVFATRKATTTHVIQPDYKPAGSAADLELTDSSGGGRKRATVKDPCPVCGHNELWFNTAQLRSADEGQTVFYECKDCGHSWSVNN